MFPSFIINDDFFTLGNRDNQGNQVHENDKKFLLVRIVDPSFYNDKTIKRFPANSIS